MKKARHLTDPNWFMVNIQQRSYGNRYFTVGIGLVTTGESGGTSKYYDRKQAEGIRDEFNGQSRPDDNPVIDVA